MDSQALLIQILVGIAAPYVWNIVKERLKWEGVKAVWFVFICSLGLGAVVFGLTGGVTPVNAADPLDVVRQVGLMATAYFGIATLIYKAFMAKQ